jgi:hypothetical protein
VEIRILADLLALQEAAAESQPRAWTSFQEALDHLQHVRGVHPDSVQRILLTGAELALKQNRWELAEGLLDRYRLVSSSEHLLHESRAVLARSALALAKGSATEAQRLLGQARDRVEQLLVELPASARGATERAPLIRRVLDGPH